MKRIFGFLGLALIFLCVFACTIPSSAEIKGSPKLRFAANMDFGEVFGDMINGAFDSGNETLQVLDAVNSQSDWKTFVIRMPLFKDIAVENPVENIIPDGIIEIPGLGEYKIDEALEITIPDDIALTSIEDIELPLDSFNSYLEGFSFSDDIKAYVYLSGIPENFLKMKLSFGDEPPIDRGFMNSKSSGIEADAETYEESSLPKGSFDLSNDITTILGSSEKNTKVNADVYVPSGAKVSANSFEDTTISAELVIWFPLAFKAGPEGSEFKIDQLNSAGDFISDIAKKEVLESVKMELTLEGGNPFDGAHILITDKNSDFVIDNGIEGNSIVFALSKEEIDYINNSDNFESEFSISFPANMVLGIPKGAFGINNISVEADISINLFGEED